VTGGMLSKANYFAAAVIGVYEDTFNTEIDEQVLDVLETVYDGLEADEARSELLNAAQPYGDLGGRLNRPGRALPVALPDPS
jgi:hypothetical protein